jgi:UV DNA damage endonuclease
MAMLTATAEETQVRIPDAEVRPRQRSKRSLGDAGIAAVESGASGAVEGGHDKSKRRRTKNNQVASKEEPKTIMENISEGEMPVKSSTGRKRKARVKEPEEVVGSVDEAGQLIQGSPVKRRKRKKIVLAGEGDEVIGTINEAGEPSIGSPVKVKRKRKVKEEPVYIIPDVEKKTTTFKGRLGE